jgi:hypothetical protein
MASAAGTVTMLHLAAIYDRHCLESAMRMFSNASAFLCRRKFRRASVIQKQEWTDHRSQLRVRKERSYGKPIADPVAACMAQDAL